MLQHQCQHSVVLAGTVELFIEDQDFVHGYCTGYQSFYTHHSKGECIDTAHLLFLFRNGWGAGHSDMWMTGYIMGWLAALYEQDMGQFALSTNEK